MAFVTEVLQRVFDHDQVDAMRVMRQIHHDGIGGCGTYASNVARAKAAQVLELARTNGHPLRCVVGRRER
jgi:ATP-dependent Clp protease adaptor protein ClpS